MEVMTTLMEWNFITSRITNNLNISHSELSEFDGGILSPCKHIYRTQSESQADNRIEIQWVYKL